jgi:hypothetical protein
MFEPILARIGTLGVAVLFLVVVGVALAPAAWDLAARTLALPAWRAGAVCRLQARVTAMLALVRHRLVRLTLGGLLVAAGSPE